MKVLINESVVMTKRSASKLDTDNMVEITDTEAKYLNLILDSGSTWTEQNIIKLRSRIGHMQQTNSKLLERLFHERVSKYSERDWNGWKITEEHSEKGIQFLKKSLFKLNGDRRNSELARNTDDEMFHAVENFSHFTFVGLDDIHYNPYSQTYSYTPIFRIHTTDGKALDYTYQGGGFSGQKAEITCWSVEFTDYVKKLSLVK